MRLTGRHALITGGGTGIGAAIARVLAEEGARVTLMGRRAGPLEDTAASLRSSRAKVLCCPGDVTDRTSVDRAFALAREANGPISILVNNAGAAESAPFLKISPEAWRDSIAVNLDALFHCCRQVVHGMVQARQGRIVTVASTAALRGYAYSAPYVAAKHGALGLMRALAVELAPSGVTANAVCPGFTDTELAARAVRRITRKTGRSEEEARAELAKLNPSGRLIAPDEIAAAVLDLIVSERNGEAVEIA